VATVIAALALPFHVALTKALPGWLARLAPPDASPALVAAAAFMAAGLVIWLLAGLAAALRLRGSGR
jgi:hypothetical protein